LKRRLVGKDINVEKDLLKEVLQNFNGSQQYVTVPVFEGVGSLISPDELNMDAINFLRSNDNELKRKSDKALQIIVTRLSAEESSQEKEQPSLLQQKLEQREGSNASASASASGGGGGLTVTILPKRPVEVQTDAIAPPSSLPVSRIVPPSTGRATSRKNQPQGKKEMNK
jgi:hypothetical protein